MVSDITFAVSQVREGGFYPLVLKKSMRSERVLMCALAEMYIKVVYTDDLSANTKRLCGTQVSAR